jgi:histidine triad (HIT) family protein
MARIATQIGLFNLFDSDCEFCAVASGRTPAFIVFEDEVSVAFLDKRPLFPGHCLLIIKPHYTTLADLPSDSIGPLFTNAQLLAAAVEVGMQAEGTFVAINNRVSQSVPHLHIHIVPRRKKDGLKGFFWPRQPYKSEAEMQEVQRAITAALNRI